MDNYVKIERRAIGPEYGLMPCMADGCDKTVCGWFTMCHRHWAMVPKATPGDGSETSEGSLVNAFYRHKPAWMVGPGATGAHKYQVDLAIECVRIQVAEEGRTSEQSRGRAAVRGGGASRGGSITR